jgi:hypothetical protein
MVGRPRAQPPSQPGARPLGGLLAQPGQRVGPFLARAQDVLPSSVDVAFSQ